MNVMGDTNDFKWRFQTIVHLEEVENLPSLFLTNDFHFYKLFFLRQKKKKKKKKKKKGDLLC